MTTPGPIVHARQPRARVLIVAEAIPRDLAACFTASPTQVPDVFGALGEVATATARHPIIAAFVPAAAFDAGNAARALKRLDPSVQVIRVGNGHAMDGPPDGVDDDLSSPIDLASLRATIGEEWVSGEAAVAATEPPSPVTPVMPPRPRPAAPEPPAPAPAIPVVDAPRARVAVTGDLGDTDLLHALLETPGGVRPVALALITQSTGWTNVRLLGKDHADPDNPGAPVTADETPVGVLVAERASAAALAAWAEWLGHWLTADERYRRYRDQAYHDDLTGAWNRRYFRAFLGEVIERARGCRRPVTVMVFDIDDFKRYNDEFGHQAGDVILQETVGLLNSVIRRCDRVCRIGGDEFAVVFADLEAPRESGSRHPESVELIARRFQEQIGSMRFPKLGLEARGTLSISGGLATFPWDGDRPETLLALADQRALESKRHGKNHLTFGAPSPDA